VKDFTKISRLRRIYHIVCTRWKTIGPRFYPKSSITFCQEVHLRMPSKFSKANRLGGKKPSGGNLQLSMKFKSIRDSPFSVKSFNIIASSPFVTCLKSNFGTFNSLFTWLNPVKRLSNISGPVLDYWLFIF